MTYIHPNDRVYTLKRALAAAIVRSEGCKSDMALIESQAVGNG
ncbi:TPA: hypothetical protein ACOEBF_000824 [Stenotrophomonas maltophilia]|jgi:hypothetical protein|nr:MULTISPECIES: hypothetical protein [Stenotrophomonas]MCV4212862.1 hypothetical protein [Pseudomonas cichorii]QNG69714.1 hypothetical protein NIPOLPBK_02932 [Stenotrophomonas maltophilia]WBL68099.1 hypothetical protein SMAL454_19350 [Stenotrophomonas maltophilia]